jgi:hypothetical protein
MLWTTEAWNADDDPDQTIKRVRRRRDGARGGLHRTGILIR